MTLKIFQKIFSYGEREPRKVALICEDQEISYSELAVSIQHLADNFRKSGVAPGDRICLPAESAPGFVAAYFACHAVGAIAVPFNPKAPPSFVTKLGELTGPRWIFRYRSSGLERCGPGKPAEGNLSPETLEQVADIILTSGTTGGPRAVALTYGIVEAMALNTSRFVGNTGLDIELNPLPLYHSFGLGRLRCCLFMGGATVLEREFLPGQILDAISKHGITGFGAVPAGFALLERAKLLQALGEFQEKIKFVEISSAPMEPRLREKLCEVLPLTRICVSYGLTEAPRATYIELHEGKALPSSVGKPCPGVEIEVRDDAGRKLEAGREGGIFIRGNIVSPGYWENASLRSRESHGWLDTEDTGYLDDLGNVHLAGRKKEIVNIGGNKVSPMDVERRINELRPGAECACCGVADPIQGELLVCCLVAPPEFFDKQNLDALRHQLAELLEPHAIPYRFVPVKQIPRTETGKVRRVVLAEIVARGFQGDACS